MERMSIGKSRFSLSDGQRLPKTRVAGTRNCRGFAVPWFPRWSFRVPGRRFGLTIRGAHDHSKPALWLLPFYPSRLRDDGYDIADYKNIHPSLGRMADFKAFIREAHRRNLRVITELIINHTSDQHPWFQRARRARPSSSLRDFYVWSNTDQKFPDTRIIFVDAENSNWAWDPLARAYFWHRSIRTNRISTLTIRECFGPSSTSCGFGSISESTGCGWTRFPI
jgi:hypothetical protein